MLQLSQNKIKVVESIENIASRREDFIRKNKYYYEDLIKFFKYNIPEGSSVLEIGCGTGDILNSVSPKRGVGIDISSSMISIAQKKYPHLEFIQMDCENITLNEKFNFIIVSDTLGYLEDIQKAFAEIKRVATPDTRIIITCHNFLWGPFLKIAELLHLKMPQMRLNWLNLEDISSLLYLENFDIIKKGRRFLFPKYLPVISWLLNTLLAHLPFFNFLCITGYIIARPIALISADPQELSVSVVVPARNEKGNIEHAVKRIPHMGKHTEIIFVEGHSTDGTLEEIQRVCAAYADRLDVKYAVQDGKGKCDAVQKGFDLAKGDILMILDADLTVPPEDLPRFYNAIATGKGEFINGSRLVYPLEKQAMQFLNILGNKCFSLMFSWILEQRIKDTLCGTKVIKKINYEKLKANREYFGNFDPFGDFDLIFGASKLNLKLVEIPIRYRARDYGTTNISRFKHGWLLLKMCLFAMVKIKFI